MAFAAHPPVRATYFRLWAHESTCRIRIESDRSVS